MKVKDIIKDVAVMVGKNEIIEYFNYNVMETDYILEAVNTMTYLVNLVINELACTYIPLEKEETIKLSNGQIEYSKFSEKVVKIIEVRDFSKKALDFEDNLEYLSLGSKIGDGEVIVKYNYMPANYGIEDTIGYQEKDISSREIAYGVASEYCINQGLFDLAVIFHERYVQSISKHFFPKNNKIRNRSWY